MGLVYMRLTLTQPLMPQPVKGARILNNPAPCAKYCGCAIPSNSR
ncbi:Uncharacterised protein [Yersinia aldovae]|nr:Uncharacterised protein [Yersinia aldovae]